MHGYLPGWRSGEYFSIAIHCDTLAEMERLFGRSAGRQGTMAMNDAFGADGSGCGRMVWNSWMLT